MILHFVLIRIILKVYWGENAPALYQGAEDLVDRLVVIGKAFGYSFSMVKTDSQLHGLPQRRVRTFYFFWLSSGAHAVLVQHNTSKINRLPQRHPKMGNPPRCFCPRGSRQ